VPRAELLVLHGGEHLAAQLVGDVRDGGRDLLATVPEHHDEVVGVQRRDGVDRVPEQAATADGVQDLRDGRPHPGALSRGEDDGRGGRRDGFGHGLQLPVSLTARRGSSDVRTSRILRRHSGEPGARAP
jgi:hypothetical protein